MVLADRMRLGNTRQLLRAFGGLHSKICKINAARLGEMPPAGLFIKRM